MTMLRSLMERAAVVLFLLLAALVASVAVVVGVGPPLLVPMMGLAAIGVAMPEMLCSLLKNLIPATAGRWTTMRHERGLANGGMGQMRGLWHRLGLAWRPVLIGHTAFPLRV